MVQGNSAFNRGDTYDLNRFISAQEGIYGRAIAEQRTRGGTSSQPLRWSTSRVRHASVVVHEELLSQLNIPTS